MGGCNYEAYVNYGTPFVPSCGLSFGEKQLELLIKLRLLLKYRDVIIKYIRNIDSFLGIKS